MNPSFDFPSPEHATIGTVGPPGHRTFFLQVAQAGSVASFKLEKQQAAALADYLASVLADLPAASTAPPPAPELIEPAVPEWTVGGIGIAYDEDADRVLLVVHEVPDADELDDDLLEEDADDDLDELPAATARLQLTRSQVASLVERSRELVAAGRPLCPFCGLPDGPDGHMCPRAN